MTDAMRAVAVALALLLCVRVAGAEEGGASWMHEAHIDLGNQASLQRGAKYYVNYCLGCHSARYVRFSRVGTDLGIDPQQLTTSLMFTADKPQQTMDIAMPPAKTVASHQYEGNASCAARRRRIEMPRPRTNSAAETSSSMPPRRYPSG